MKKLNLKDFTINRDTVYYITKPHESQQIINVMSAELGPLENLIITDGTAFVGGDSIRFSQYFKGVNSVEMNKANFDFLVKNIRNFNKTSKIRAYNADYTNIYRYIIQDVIYIDPPWGGPAYKNKKDLHLFLGPYEIGTFIKLLLEVCPIIFMKSPINLNIDSFKEFIYNVTKITDNYGRYKFNLISLRRII
jgi:predicted RNA methylase